MKISFVVVVVVMASAFYFLSWNAWGKYTNQMITEQSVETVVKDGKE